MDAEIRDAYGRMLWLEPKDLAEIATRHRSRSGGLVAPTNPSSPAGLFLVDAKMTLLGYLDDKNKLPATGWGGQEFLFHFVESAASDDVWQAFAELRAWQTGHAKDYYGLGASMPFELLNNIAWDICRNLVTDFCEKGSQR